MFPDPLVQAILIVKESLLDQADTATYCMGYIYSHTSKVSALAGLGRYLIHNRCVTG
jgi:hypothetical protein